MSFKFKGIKYARVRKGLKQSELSDKINCFQNQISNFENGKTVPHIKNLWKIAKVLDVSMEQLMEGYAEYLDEHPDKDLPESIKIEEEGGA